MHPVFNNYLERNFLPRNATKPPAGGPYEGDENVLAFPWDGTRMHDNGNGTADHRKVVPDGSYKIVVKALKAGGDSRQPGALGDADVADDHDRPPVTGVEIDLTEGRRKPALRPLRRSRLRRRARTPP